MQVSSSPYPSSLRRQKHACGVDRCNPADPELRSVAPSTPAVCSSDVHCSSTHRVHLLSFISYTHTHAHLVSPSGHLRISGHSARRWPHWVSPGQAGLTSPPLHKRGAKGGRKEAGSGGSASCPCGSFPRKRSLFHFISYFLRHLHPSVVLEFLFQNIPRNYFPWIVTPSKGEKGR